LLGAAICAMRRPAHGARATSPAFARPGVAVACAQRDAYRELVEYCWRLVDAERERLFKYTRLPPEPSAGSLRLMTGMSLGEHVLNNFSLLAANHVKHLNVVMLALACVTLVVGFGLVHSALAQEPTSISAIVARVTGTIIRAF
jgi:hypothetical protein